MSVYLSDVEVGGRARFYFRRKTGYMSPYTWGSVRQILSTYPERGLPVADLYIRIGSRAFQIRKGEYR